MIPVNDPIKFFFARKDTILGMWATANKLQLYPNEYRMIIGIDLANSNTSFPGIADRWGSPDITREELRYCSQEGISPSIVLCHDCRELIEYMEKLGDAIPELNKCLAPLKYPIQNDDIRFFYVSTDMNCLIFRKNLNSYSPLPNSN